MGSEDVQKTFFVRRIFLKASHKIVPADTTRMWIRTCKFFAKELQSIIGENNYYSVMRRVYDSHSIYESILEEKQISSAELTVRTSPTIIDNDSCLRGKQV
jgi:hypothetical protein